MDNDSGQRKGFKIFDDDNLSPDNNTFSETETANTKEGPVNEKRERSGRVLPFFLTVLAMFVLGGIGVSGYFAYEHLNERLNYIERTGAHEVAGLSDEIDERMGVFSTQFASRHAEMQVHIESLATTVKNNSEAISDMKRSGNEQRQALSRNITGLENRFAKLDERVSSFESTTAEKIGVLENQVNTVADAAAIIRKISAEMEDIRQSVGNLESRFETVSDQVAALDIDDLRKQMDKINRDLNQQIEAANIRVNREIVSLEDKISALEAMLKSLRDLALPRNDSPGIIEQDLQ